MENRKVLERSHTDLALHCGHSCGLHLAFKDVMCSSQANPQRILHLRELSQLQKCQPNERTELDFFSATDGPMRQAHLSLTRKGWSVARSPVKTDHRPGRASQVVAGLMGVQEPFTRLSTRLIAAHFWGKAEVCTCLCQVSN